MDLKSLLPKYSPLNSETNFDYTFTVFTPVYNRSDTLHRVFTSLNNQSYKNFELVIINDGSTDSSHKVIIDLIEKASFRVNYINNSINRHKMACFIQAIQVAKGKFLLPFDSDDECSNDALKTFYNEYQNISDKIKNKISGVTCLCKDQNDNIVGNRFPEQPYYSNTFLRTITNPNDQEKWGFTKTQILKGIDINPAIFAKGLIPEGIIWELLSKEGFKTKYINNVLRTYYLDTENRLSNLNLEKDSFGMVLYSLSVLNWFYKDYFIKKPTLFLKRLFTLLRGSHFLNYKKRDYLLALDSKVIKLLFVLAWPFKHLFFRIKKTSHSKI